MMSLCASGTSCPRYWWGWGTTPPDTTYPTGLCMCWPCYSGCWFFSFVPFYSSDPPSPPCVWPLLAHTTITAAPVPSRT
uniref:Uncharacterized protein n=1 Tax=Anguilla anguilla TaxID=7936 RepID=A0A0E9RJ11_ANGAN